MKFKITPEQVKILKKAAVMEASPSIPLNSILLEPGVRFNTQDPSVEKSINILLVSKDKSWSDTDLYDYEAWSEFRKSQELTADGNGIFDFYIRRRADEYSDLHGNVSLYIENGEMIRIEGYSKDGDLWTKEGGFRK